MPKIAVCFFELNEDGSVKSKWTYSGTETPAFKLQDKIILALEVPDMEKVPLGGEPTHVIDKCHYPIFSYKSRERFPDNHNVETIIYLFRVKPITPTTKSTEKLSHMFY